MSLSLAPATAQAAKSFQKVVVPLLREFCFDCHGPEEQMEGIGLHLFPDKKAVQADRKLWGKVLRAIEFGKMPPEGADQPTGAQRKQLASWLRPVLTEIDCDLPRDPGRVTIRRLNRSEYDNTIRDLLGIDLRPARDFPSDDVGEGFDNIGDVLSLPPLLFEKYMDAAERMARAAIPIPDLARLPRHRREKKKLTFTGNGELLNNGMYAMWSTATVAAEFDFPKPGSYWIRVEAGADQAGQDPAKLAVTLDGRSMGVLSVQASPKDPDIYRIRVPVAKQGRRRIAAKFTNDYYNPKATNPDDRDRNAYVRALEVIGPWAPNQRGVTQYHDQSRLQVSGSGRTTENQFVLVSTASVEGEFTFPHDGDYLLRTLASADQAGPELAKIAVAISGKTVATLEVKARSGQAEYYTVKTRVSRGKHKWKVTFVNDYYNPQAPNPANRDRNVYIRALEVEDPTRPRPVSLTTVRPGPENSTAAVARQLLTPLVRRAFRRPVGRDEVEPYVQLVVLATERGELFETGLRVAVAGVLVSPQFLFRIEQGTQRAQEKTRTLTDFELATRLAYFLWSSMPDAELFRLAQQGRLQHPQELRQQVARMLRDPKARALVDNFAGQWLNLRNLDNVTPDQKKYGEFDDGLREDMKQETLEFFAAVMREDRNVLDFLDAKFTFVNQRLAKHYGIPGVEGSAFRRVVLDRQQRAGVLTHASILTLTSNPTRTSPVKRGKWIMENILGTPPPDPPADVPELEATQKVAPQLPLRKQMEIHRKNPSCAVCHREMDVLGLGFENFDAIGKWRDKDGELDIDPAGTLPDGRRFSGPIELVTILKSRHESFTRTLAEKMLTYALGRGLEFYDRCAIDKMTQAMMEQDHRFSVLITQTVLSEPFRLGRSEQPRAASDRSR